MMSMCVQRRYHQVEYVSDLLSPCSQGHEITSVSAFIYSTHAPRDSFELSDDVYELRFGSLARAKQHASTHANTLLIELDNDSAALRDFGSHHVLHVDSRYLRSHLLMLIFFADTLRHAQKGRRDDDSTLGVARFSMAIVCAGLRNLTQVQEVVQQVSEHTNTIIRSSLRQGFCRVPFRKLLMISQCDHSKFISMYGAANGICVLTDGDHAQFRKDSVDGCWKMNFFTDSHYECMEQEQYSARFC